MPVAKLHTKVQNACRDVQYMYAYKCTHYVGCQKHVSVLLAIPIHTVLWSIKKNARRANNIQRLSAVTVNLEVIYMTITSIVISLCARLGDSKKCQHGIH